MTKITHIKTSPVRRNQGFTLVEMLVVAALIAIFAGLAVFNIVEQLNREKEKAAIAEARSIATAMSFVYDDMGFYPKLCFLRYGLDELTDVITKNNLPSDAIDYYGFPNPTMATRLKSNWGDKYMAGSMPEKYAQMRFNTSTGPKTFDWPRDPFNQPYVAYLVKMDAPQGSPAGTQKQPMWLESLGDKPNYFAGIVSYGRNKVPGLKWDADQATVNGRKAGRLFADGGTNNLFILPNRNAYTQIQLELLTKLSTDGVAGINAGEYTIREAGSDDKFFEF